MLSRIILSLFFIILFLGSALSNDAWALGSSGFENASYSAESLAQGNAMVARPDDPDAVVWNPAGLPDLKGVQYSGGLAGINTFTFFTSKATGDHEKNVPQLALVPNSYLTINPGKLMGDRFGFGIGATSPFGLSNRYDSIGNLAQYTGYHNSLKMVAMTLSGGVKLHDQISLGGGAVYYNIYKYAQVLNFPNSFILAPAVGPNTFPDGLARTDTKGSSWGWIASALYKPTKTQRFGVFYRSKTSVDVHGNVKIENINPLLLGTFPTIPNFQTFVRSEVNLPSNLTLAYAYVPSDRWAVEFDLGYTRWSTFKDQDFSFERPNSVLRSLGTIPRDYNDVWSFHLGGHYKATKKVDLMAGGFFYTAASPKDHFDNVIPDSNRLGGTFGFRYNIFKNTSLDFAYLAMLYTRRTISNPGVFSKTGLSIDGRYTTFTQEFMVNCTIRFDMPFSKGPKDTSGLLKSVQKR